MIDSPGTPGVERSRYEQEGRFPQSRIPGGELIAGITVRIEAPGARNRSADVYEKDVRIVPARVATNTL